MIKGKIRAALAGYIRQLLAEEVAVEVINRSGNPLPQYETDGAGALDIRANNIKTMVIPAGGHALIQTGLFVAVPKGYKLRLAGRSGLSFKSAVEVHRGIIDSDYRGPLGVIVYNHSDAPFKVECGDRVCQAFLQRVVRIKWVETDELAPTDRGEGGFGSTGRK